MKLKISIVFALSAALLLAHHGTGVSYDSSKAYTVKATVTEFRYANKVPPRQWTAQNIAAMKQTHRRFAFSYDWNREIATCEPEYYRLNQWFFLKMLERRLASRKRALDNWCPKCATVLANEQVVE